MNSQGELNFIDYNAAINAGPGSLSNVSEYDRAIKSAAQKYRHRIPSTEAIEEEQEIVKVGGSSGIFRRNPNIDEDDAASSLRRTPTAYGYNSSAGP